MDRNWTRLETPWYYLGVEERSLARVDGSGEHGSELDQTGDPLVIPGCRGTVPGPRGGLWLEWTGTGPCWRPPGITWV